MAARDLRQLCRHVLNCPGTLPQVTALYGIPFEMGANYSHHWWYARASERGSWASHAARAVPYQAYPELEGMQQLELMTARQLVEHTLGPAPFLKAP